MNDLRKIILSHLPHSFLEDTLSLLYDAYSNAHMRVTQEFHPCIAKNLVGYERRARIERDWPILACKHGLSESYEPNDCGSWYHIVIRNSHFVLTHSCVAGPQQLVQKAIFRETLASSSQLDLFSTNRDIDSNNGKRRIYLLLLHGPGNTQKEYPAFAHLVVPSHDCKEYLARIDLFKHCPDRLRKLSVKDLELIQPYCKIKILKKRNEDTEA